MKSPLKDGGSNIDNALQEILQVFQSIARLDGGRTKVLDLCIAGQHLVQDLREDCRRLEAPARHRAEHFASSLIEKQRLIMELNPPRRKK